MKIYIDLPPHRPAEADVISYWANIAVFSGLLALAVVLTWRLRLNLTDDAFIYLRIAENLVHRHEWAFNPGVPVNAATSPLYAMLLACVTALRLPGVITPLLVVSVLGLLFLGTGIYLGLLDAGDMEADRETPLAVHLRAACFALAAINFPALLLATGLETPVYLALIVMTCLAFSRRRPVAMGFAAGLTALGRPEGCLLFLILAALERLRSRSMPWRSLPAFLVPPIVWLLFCRHTFGSIVPHTMAIKAIQASMSIWSRSFLVEFLEQLPAGRWLFPIVLLGLYSILSNLKRNLFLGAIVIFGLVQTAGYVVLHAPATYFWYDAPGDLAYMLCVVEGGIVLLQWLATRWTDRLPGRVYPTGLIVLLSMQILVALAWSRTHAAPYRDSEGYKTISRWLRDHAAPGDWVAAAEIGYIGVYADRPVRDLWGLADPESVAPLQRRHWGWWLENGRPTRFVVVHQRRWFAEPGHPSTPLPAELEQSFNGLYQPVLTADRLLLLEKVH